MATPHALITILQSHLQALYNVIIFNFCNRDKLVPDSYTGVAVTLLRLIREVDKDVGNVNRKEGVGRGGGSIATPK